MSGKPNRNPDIRIPVAEYRKTYTDLADYAPFCWWTRDGGDIVMWYTDKHRYQLALEEIKELTLDAARSFDRTDVVNKLMVVLSVIDKTL